MSTLEFERGVLERFGTLFELRSRKGFLGAQILNPALQTIDFAGGRSNRDRFLSEDDGGLFKKRPPDNKGSCSTGKNYLL